MATVRLRSEESAPPELKAVFEEIREHFGLDEIHNGAKAFVYRPEVLQQSWDNYKEAEKTWGKETLFLINLAVAMERNCPYAINFNTAMLKQLGYEDSKIENAVHLISSAAQRYDYVNGLQIESDVTPDTVARKMAA